MKRLIAILTVLTAASAAAPTTAQTLDDVRKLRREEKGDKDVKIVRYQFTEDTRHVTPAEQAAIRGCEAAEAFADFVKSTPIAVVARSSYGGAGQQGGGYWPPGVNPELLRKLVEPLKKRGLSVELPELPDPEDEDADERPADAEAEKEEEKPYPKIGFSEDYEFVLVVGLHHEDIPYKGLRRQADGRPVYDRSSRVNAWAILFHAPTGNGFWGATASARVNHRTSNAPLNDAVASVLAYLNFADIGEHNIPDLIKKFQTSNELPAVDMATLLVQTQRADAVEAVVTASMKPPAFKNTAWVLRYFDGKGTPQDFRTEPEDAQKKRETSVSQPLMLRILYMEQLRGATGVPASAMVAGVTYADDMQIHPLGAEIAGRLRPMCPDDEIVLLGELSEVDPYNREGYFYKNATTAVRNLGSCRKWIDEAIVVAKVYANRPDPKPVRGRPRRDPIKEAGKAALAELSKAKQEQRQKEQDAWRKLNRLGD